jgi:coatomer subunit alpha
VVMSYLLTLLYPLAAHMLHCDDDAHKQGVAVPDTLPNATLLQPPTPIVRGDNWPLLAVSKGPIDGATTDNDPVVSNDYQEPAGDAWVCTYSILFTTALLCIMPVHCTWH